MALNRAYGQTGVWDNGQDVSREATTVFARLRNVGYRTMACGKTDLHKKSNDFDTSGWTGRLGDYGFVAARDLRGKMNAGKAAGLPAPSDYYTRQLEDSGVRSLHYEDYARRCDEAAWYASTWPSPLPLDCHTDTVTADAALALLDESPTSNRSHSPWLLWVNFPGPHDPFDPPAEYQCRYTDVDFPPPIAAATDVTNSRGETIALDHHQLRRNYAACIEHIDALCGRILGAVDARGERENTLVVFASDHGELLGDHGRFQKSTWHEGSVHVPLILAGPGIRQGSQSDALVQLTDISATLLDIGGAGTAPDDDGRSLLPCASGVTSEALRKVQCSALWHPHNRRGWRMVCDGRWKWIQDSGGETRLFDLAADPGEIHDGLDDHGEQAARLQADAPCVPAFG